jgi:hypothetical protein
MTRDDNMLCFASAAIIRQLSVGYKNVEINHYAE